MKSLARRSLMLVATLVGALALGVAPAQAQNAHWTPPNVDVWAESTNSILEYDDETVQCDISEAHANTNDGGMGGPTPNGLLNELTFGTPPDFDDCPASLFDFDDFTTGGFPWGLVAVAATGGGDGEVEIRIPEGGGVWWTSSVFGTPICKFHIEGPQTVGADWDSTNQGLLVGNDRTPPDSDNVTVTVEGAVCPFDPGPSPGTFSGIYEVTVTDPPNTTITIQPWP